MSSGCIDHAFQTNGCFIVYISHIQKMGQLFQPITLGPIHFMLLASVSCNWLATLKKLFIAAGQSLSHWGFSGYPSGYHRQRPRTWCNGALGWVWIVMALLLCWVKCGNNLLIHNFTRNYTHVWSVSRKAQDLFCSSVISFQCDG